MSPNPGGRLGRRYLPVLVASLVWLAGGVGAARADEVDEFGRAKNAYDAGNYALAVQRFGALLDGGASRIQSHALSLEARKYLAVSLMFVGRRADALVEFERLLRDEPDYQLDPVMFPTEVLDAFGEVRTRVGRDREQIDAQRRRRREAERQAEEQRQRGARERLLEQVRPQVFEREVVRRSRWLAPLPFGIGQFQNDQPTKGWIFLVSEGFLFVVNVASYWARLALGPYVDPLNPVNFDPLWEALGVVNFTSLGLLAAAVIGGAIDGLLSFEPPQPRWRRLPPDRVPPGLRRSEVGLRLGPSGLSLRLGF